MLTCLQVNMLTCKQREREDKDMEENKEIKKEIHKMIDEDLSKKQLEMIYTFIKYLPRKKAK